MSLNSLIRKLGVLSMAGGVAAVPLITALTLTGWGTPGTAAYQTYELLNRLMAFSLLLMMAGWMGLFLVMPRGYGRWAVLLALAGATFMVIGNAAEFWLFSDLSYDCCNVRHAAWSTFLLGLLATVIGATVSGLAVRRAHNWPQWRGLLLMLALPLGILGFGITPFLGPAVLALALGWLLLTRTSPIQVQSEVAT